MFLSATITVSEIEKNCLLKLEKSLRALLKCVIGGNMLQKV